MTCKPHPSQPIPVSWWSPTVSWPTMQGPSVMGTAAKECRPVAWLSVLQSEGNGCFDASKIKGPPHSSLWSPPSNPEHAVRISCSSKGMKKRKPDGVVCLPSIETLAGNKKRDRKQSQALPVSVGHRHWQAEKCIYQGISAGKIQARNDA